MNQPGLFDLQETSSQAATDAAAPQTDSATPSLLAVDTETTGPDPLRDSLVGISLCRDKDSAYYVPLRHTRAQNLPEAIEILKPFMEDRNIAKVGHNIKFDLMVLSREGIRIQGPLYDTMIASYLLNPNKPSHSLAEVSLEYLLHRKRSFTDVIDKAKSFADLPIEIAAPYAAEDALLAWELWGILRRKLEEQNLDALFQTIEMPLVPVLADMETQGILVDTACLGVLAEQLGHELAFVEQEVYRLAGESFNINSPKQLSRILFDKLGLPPLKRTKTGYSTGVEILESLAKTHDLPAAILNYRTLFKLKTTYLDTLPRLVHPETGRLHTSFNQTVTATGRLSSSEPNLQNIPVRGTWGRKIREAFIAPPGHLLISADYSQIELRILAHMSGDDVLRDAFLRGLDIHSRTASELFGVPVDAVTPDMRRLAKTVNFGVIYGISAFGLSEALGIPPKEAGIFIDKYFRTHEGVKRYTEETLQNARKSGYVMTYSGRKRPLPDLHSATVAARQQAERMAINMPVQGTAADLIKIAMLRIWHKLKKKHPDAKMLLQIHDELLIEAPEGQEEAVTAIVRREMEGAMELSVPIRVDTGSGKNWAEAH